MIIKRLCEDGVERKTYINMETVQFVTESNTGEIAIYYINGESRTVDTVMMTDKAKEEMWKQLEAMDGNSTK